MARQVIDFEIKTISIAEDRRLPTIELMGKESDDIFRRRVLASHIAASSVVTHDLPEAVEGERSNVHG